VFDQIPFRLVRVPFKCQRHRLTSRCRRIRVCSREDEPRDPSERGSSEREQTNQRLVNFFD
jgi:hypothetical protein